MQSLWAIKHPIPIVNCLPVIISATFNCSPSLNHSFMQFATPWFKTQHKWKDLSPGVSISLIATKKALKMLGYAPFWGFTSQHFARINLQIFVDGHEKTIHPRKLNSIGNLAWPTITQSKQLAYQSYVTTLFLVHVVWEMHVWEGG